MSLEKLVSFVSRVFLVCAFVSLGIVVVERIANATGYTILQGKGANLVEFAIAFLVFVIALQLREIKEDLKRGRT
jgi:hypothetical protein